MERPFNSLMTEFFKGSDISDLIQRMPAQIKTQAENSWMLESGFSQDKIMHLYINFHRLALTQGGSYNQLPKWIKSKRAVINPQNKDEECFKWAVIAALRYKEIKKIVNANRRWDFIKADITGKDLSFQYRSRRSISLKKRNLT